MTQPEVKLTPESATALADKVIDAAVVPKKIPKPDDIDAQIKAVGGALASALLTATEVPLTTLQPVVGELASQLVALGIRQTDAIDPKAIHAPGWIVNGVRQEAIALPDAPEPTEAEPVVARTAQAPPMPLKIPNGAMAAKVVRKP